MTDLSRGGPALRDRAIAELVGTAFLVAAVVGSGIAAQRLSPDDVALQLLENALATGAALAALIIALQPVCGTLEALHDRGCSCGLKPPVSSSDLAM
jgi:hypothetical protein